MCDGTSMIEVPSHTDQALISIVNRAIETEDIVITDEAKNKIIDVSGGDARTALNILEAASLSGKIPIEADDLLPFLSVRGAGLDKNLQVDAISALQKSVRGSHKDAALLYLAFLLENGEDPLYVARRIVRMASEDVGPADPLALVIATAAFTATQQTGMPECVTALTQAVVYLCDAPKSNACEVAYIRAREAVKAAGDNFRVPANISVRKLGYVYTNQPEIRDPSAFAGVQEYLPEGFTGGPVFPSEFCRR